jgi:DNA-binding NarL/FixJ family response regulator
MRVDMPEMTYSEALQRIREIDSKYGKWVKVSNYSAEDQAALEECRQVVRKSVLDDPC